MYKPPFGVITKPRTTWQIQSASLNNKSLDRKFSRLGEGPALVIEGHRLYVGLSIAIYVLWHRPIFEVVIEGFRTTYEGIPFPFLSEICTGVSD